MGVRSCLCGFWSVNLDFVSPRTERYAPDRKVYSCGSFAVSYIWISFSTQARMTCVSINRHLSREHDFECCSCPSLWLLRPICLKQVRKHVFITSWCTLQTGFRFRVFCVKKYFHWIKRPSLPLWRRPEKEVGLVSIACTISSCKCVRNLLLPTL